MGRCGIGGVENQGRPEEHQRQSIGDLGMRAGTARLGGEATLEKSAGDKGRAGGVYHRLVVALGHGRHACPSRVRGGLGDIPQSSEEEGVAGGGSEGILADEGGTTGRTDQGAVGLAVNDPLKGEDGRMLPNPPKEQAEGWERVEGRRAPRQWHREREAAWCVVGTAHNSSSRGPWRWTSRSR